METSNGKKPLIITQIVSRCPLPPRGGLELTVYSISSLLSKKGYHIYVIAPGKNTKIIERDVKYYCFQSILSVPRLFFPKIKYIKYIIHILRHSDVIHIHSTHEFFSFTIVLLAKIFLKKRVILATFLPFHNFSNLNFTKKIIWLIIYIITYISILTADIVYVKNIGDYYLLKKIKSKNSYLIPDGINKEFFLYSYKPPSSKNNIIKITYIGRIDTKKGIRDFLKLQKILMKKYLTNTRLTIISFDTHAKEKIKNIVKEESMESDDIDIRYNVDTKEKIKLLDKTDIVVIPSLYDYVEGFSIVASEAWARKKPVVAYPVGALKYRVKNGKNGYLAEEKTPEALAKAVLKAAKLENISIPWDVMPWEKIVEIIEQIYWRAVNDEKP